MSKIKQNIGKKKKAWYSILPIQSTSDASTSLSSQINSTPSDNECTPDSIFFLIHAIQCQTPSGTSSKGGYRQERW